MDSATRRLYGQCFLVAKSMDSPAHVAALRQAFIDSGAVAEQDLRALESDSIPDLMNRSSQVDDQRRKMPCTLGAFHHMLRRIRDEVGGQRDPLAGEIERVFDESRLTPDEDVSSVRFKEGFERWLPEVRSLRRGPE